jgi:hypothetical protein
MQGTVYRHVPQSNAQGGVLVVDWDNGVRGRIGPIVLTQAGRDGHGDRYGRLA